MKGTKLVDSFDYVLSSIANGQIPNGKLGDPSIAKPFQATYIWSIGDEYSE